MTTKTLWTRQKENLTLALLAWMPSLLGQKLRRLVYRIILGEIGNSVKIAPGVELRQASGIEFGDRVKLQRDVRLRSYGQNSKIRLREGVHLDRGVDIRTHRQGDIEIGENTYIGPYTCLSGDTIKIGKYCLIASHSGIYANNHTFTDPTRNIKEQESTYKGIAIEDDCWLGSGVKVLDGVTIGQGSVIGAGAVVTKNIPPYSIAVGVPAKVVAKRDGKQQHPVETEVLQMTSATRF